MQYRACAPSAWVAVLLLLSSLQATLAQDVPFFGNNEVIHVCTTDNPPLVYCKDRQPDEYTGYEIELFLKVAGSLGWAESMLNWTCGDWDDNVADLSAGNGTCDIAVMGMTIRQEYLDKNFTFTWPTLKGGWSIMVLAEEDNQGYFAFMDAFTYQLWLAIILTSLGIGVVVWAVERWAVLGRYKPYPGEPPPAPLTRHIWRAMGRPMQTEDMYTPSFAGSIIIIVFSFMMLILVAIYTGNTAAALTTKQLNTPIRAVSDLPGRAVGTFEGYVSKLKQRSIDAIGFPLDNVEEDIPRMFQALRDREISALVLDSVILNYYVATECDLTVVGKEFQEYFQAVTFPAGFNNSKLLDAYNFALVALRETGQLDDLYDTYISPPEASCKSTSAQDETNKVTFQQVSGLWLLLGASIGVACLLAFINRWLGKGAKRLVRSPNFKKLSVKLSMTVRSMRSTIHGRNSAQRRSAKSGLGQHSTAHASVHSMAHGSSLRTLPTAASMQTMETGHSLPSILEGGEVPEDAPDPDSHAPPATSYPPPQLSPRQPALDANGGLPSFRKQPSSRNYPPISV